MARLNTMMKYYIVLYYRWKNAKYDKAKYSEWMDRDNNNKLNKIRDYSK